MIDANLVPVEAASTVGLVLLEAVVLYVAYGAVTAVLEPRLMAALEAR